MAKNRKIVLLLLFYYVLLLPLTVILKVWPLRTVGPRGLPHGWPPPSPKLFLKYLNESNSLITASMCFDKLSILKLKLVLLRAERVYAWLQFSVLLILCFINSTGLLLHTWVCKYPNSCHLGEGWAFIISTALNDHGFNCCSSCFLIANCCSFCSSLSI